MEKLMNMEMVCKMFNVKVSWVRSQLFKKKIPYIKIGRLIRFSREDLVKWADKNSTEAV